MEEVSCFDDVSLVKSGEASVNNSVFYASFNSQYIYSIPRPFRTAAHKINSESFVLLDLPHSIPPNDSLNCLYDKILALLMVTKTRQAFSCSLVAHYLLH
jgi:hypothetical protein